jgi:multicomponent Na+:H+ antiporter subunit G
MSNNRTQRKWPKMKFDSRTLRETARPMREFFFGAAGLVLVLVAIGLLRILRGPQNVDRMMAAQLLGSGGIAVLLLAAGGGLPGAADVALTLALLASFVTCIRRVRSFAAKCRQATRQRGMSAALNVFSVAAISLGVFFFLAGTVGLLRFPDTLTRLHALTKADNLGLGLTMLGLLPHVAWPFGALKLFAIWLLVMVASAGASQLVARAVRNKP